LSHTFTLIYATSSLSEGYITSSMDQKLRPTLTSAGMAGITEETLTLTFGEALTNLWAQKRSSAGGLTYQTYASDIPETYPQNVYAIDPITGSEFSVDAEGNLVYTLLHEAGDPVLDGQGDPVYRHRQGETVLDGQGNPILITDLTSNRHVDLLLVDGLYYFATDTNYVQYRQELAEILTTYVTSNLAPLVDILLEETRVFYYPKKALGLVWVTTGDDVVFTLEAGQSFEVVLYVDEATHRDLALRSTLTFKTIEVINAGLQNSVVSTDDLVAALRTAYGNTVISVSLQGLGGVNNYSTVSLLNEHERLSLKKTLVVLETGKLAVQEAVNVSFVKYSNP
jgi:hypothetical protein